MASPEIASSIPDFIGPYQILERLGRGGMGVVYRAAHERTGALAAVKTVLVPSGRHLGAIRREIQALARVQHPGIVRIVDEGVDTDGLPWYAMELLNGMSLREYRFTPSSMTPVGAPTRSAEVAPERDAFIAPTSPLPRKHWKPVLSIFRKLCAPLAYVHGEGLVHCDLKPENVFLRFDLHPVLVDFGLMSRFGSDLHREILDVDLFMGTAEYMAPEQWEGKPVDARTDLYALGCILFEAIAGRPPFSGDRGQLYRAHLAKPPPRLSEHVSDVPEDLDDLLLRLLAKRPRDRIGHADEVARLLAILGAEGPREVGPTARPYLFRPSFSGRGQATHEVIELVATGTENGRIVVLEGESGVGKTRLAMEAARMSKRGGVRVLTGECSPILHDQPHAIGSVLHPFKSILVHITDLVRERGDATFHELLDGRARILARVEPQIALLPQTDALPELVTLSVDAERARMLSALVATLSALGREQRTFIVLDDIQWADELTLELFHLLVRMQSSWRDVVILATCRTEEMPASVQRLTAHDDVGHVRLARLGPRAVETVVSEMLGFPPPSHFAQFMAEQTGGNPFFVAEYPRAAMTRGLLMRDGQGKWSVTLHEGRYDALGLPNTLDDVLALRLDTLAADARAFVDAAAVLGREASPQITQRVSERADRTVRVGIEELLRKQILTESADGRLRFAHDKLREVTYDRIDPKHRHALHRRAAEAIEALAKTPSPAALAYHWEEGGEPARAIVYLEQAADLAIAAGAHRDAAAHLERLLSLAGKPGASVAARHQTARWHRQLGAAHLASGALDTSRDHSSRALALLDLAPPQSPGEWAVKLVTELARQVAHRLLPPKTYEEPTSQTRLAEATQASGTIARIAFFENDALQIVASALWSINLAERASHLMEAARNYSGLGWVFGLAGLHKVADGYFDRAHATGAAQKDYAGLIFSLTSEAVYRIGRGQWKRAAKVLADCDAPLDVLKDPQARELVETLRGHPDYFAGRFDEAISRHRFVLDSARQRENRQHEAWSLYCAARSALELERYAEAIEDLETAAGLLDDVPDLMSEVTCYGLLASARCRVQDLQGATRAARRAEEAIGSRAPTVFLMLHGYEGIVEVALARLAAAPPAERGARDAEFRRALRRLSGATRTFPVGAPRVARWRARYFELLGDAGRARRWASREAELAKELGVPIAASRAPTWPERP